MSLQEMIWSFVGAVSSVVLVVLHPLMFLILCLYFNGEIDKIGSEFARGATTLWVVTLLATQFSNAFLPEVGPNNAENRQ